MIKNIFIVAITVCFGFISRAQSGPSAFLSSLYTSQKAYTNTEIQKKYISQYHSCISYANTLLPRVYDEIRKIDTTFWNASGQTNLLEFFPSYANVKGVLWKTNGTYYSFWLDDGKKLNVQAKPIGYLDTKFQAIIESFANWGGPVFSTHGAALGSPAERPFFMASKITTDSTTTLGFYY